VLGQAQTSRRRVVALAILGAAFLALPAIGVANPLNHGRSTPEAVPAFGADAGSTAVDVSSLDRTVFAAQDRIATLDQRIAALRTQLVVAKQQAVVSRRGIALERAKLGVAVRTLYEQGDVEPLEVFLGAKSLDEALSSLDGLSRLGDEAHGIVVELTAIEARARKAQRSLARREAALVEAAREARAAREAALAALAARREYLAQLAAQRNLAVQSQPATAEVADVQTVASDAPVVAPAPQPSLAGRRLTVSATAYSLPGYTASGLHVAWGTVAVDPNLIPLGTRMTIPGYGEAIAADVGTAIIGARVDLWFPTLAMAQAWGRRTVTIVIH
jgi:3D (Asp-Asp-Asp) domain-containing protein